MTKAKTKHREATPDLLQAAGVEEIKKGDTVVTIGGKVAKVVKATPVKKKAASQEVVVHQLPTASPQNLLMALMGGIADPDSKPEKVHVLLDARDRLMKQEAEVAFIAAYIAMSAELPEIDAKGRIEIPVKPGARSQRAQNTPYATYQEINRITKPILARHKFGMMMLPDVGPSGVGILMRGKLAYVCDTPYGRLVHIEECAIAAPLETGGSKNNVQGIGSSLSYTKRYAAVALLNLVSHAVEDKDDDGNAAGKKRGARAEPEEEATKEIAFVTPKQIEELKVAIQDCGVGLDVVYEKYAIADLKEVTSDVFPAIMKACATFKANNKGRSNG